MRLKWLLSLACILCLVGCAKFPPAGSALNATRLSFRFSLNGPVNPNYIYVVAIRVLTPTYGTGDTSLADPTQGPTPIVDVGSKNGIVGGLPTHYVVYVPTDLNGLYSVYRFPTRQEEGTSADPSDPAAIDLRWPGVYVGDVLPGSAINPMNSDGTFGMQMGFDIDTSYLSQHANGAPIQVIQFNILTMNLPATTSGNVAQRVMDAIGNQSNLGGSTFSNPIQVNITTGNTYTDQTSSVPEVANDTFPSGSNLPAVDLTGWSLTVSPP